MHQIPHPYTRFRPTTDSASSRTAAHSTIAADERSHIAQLTAQQQRVFALLSEGLSNKEIARVLGLHESTVKVHVSAVLARLSCRNRTTAALLSLRYKLWEAELAPASEKERPDVCETRPMLPLRLPHPA